jgi:serine/threonine-protein kinase
MICPTPEELAAFGSGLLADKELSSIAEHLEGCTACSTVLASLLDSPLAARLRGLPPLQLDPEVQCIEEAARGLGPQGGEVTRSDGSTAPSWPTEEPAASFGPYEIYEQLEAGGMGVVYRARHIPLNRLTALKMLPAGGEREEGSVARFCVEAEAIARLKHPNVVEIYDFGEHQGKPYLAMEYVGGGTLAGKLRNGLLSVHDAADLLATVARAVHAAHEKQVVHRDLKPSNILLTDEGAPKVGDFGLAKLVDDTELALTRPEQVMGTAPYMAPEQAEGRSHEAGAAADIWALGVILYESLTGRVPFKGKNRLRTLDLICRTEPMRPSQLRRELPLDLEAVCLKCLEKEPARRYVTAAEVAEDLERWSRGESTHARPARWARRLLRGLRRRPGRAAASMLAVAALVVSLATLYFKDPDRRERSIENRLDRGEKVVLIPETGGPAWSERVIGKNAGVVTVERDGTFIFESWRTTCLELVRDPRRSHYWFRADVYHHQGQNATQIGVYFLHGRCQAPRGTLHWFYFLAFNDLFSEIENHDREFMGRFPPNAPPRPLGNPIYLEPYFFAEDEAGPLPRRGLSRRYCTRTFIPPAKRTDLSWRKLAVRVSPEMAEVYWEGEKVAEITAGRQAADALELQKFLDENKAAYGLDGSVAPRIEFAPRLSLGLFAGNGSAYFRNVAVEPFDPGS